MRARVIGEGVSLSAREAGELEGHADRRIGEQEQVVGAGQQQDLRSEDAEIAARKAAREGVAGVRTRSCVEAQQVSAHLSVQLERAAVEDQPGDGAMGGDA